MMEIDSIRTAHHHGRLRNAVIEIAVAEAQRGTIDALSIRDVSRRLGVSPGAVYRHFADRDAIMHSVAQAGFDLLARRFETALPFATQALDGEEALSRYQSLAVAYVTFARDHYGLWRLMFGPYGRSPASTTPTRPSTYDWLGKSLAELYQFGMIDSVGDEDRYFVWTAIHGFSDLQTSPAFLHGPLGPAARRYAIRLLQALRPRGNMTNSVRLADKRKDRIVLGD